MIHVADSHSGVRLGWCCCCIIDVDMSSVFMGSFGENHGGTLLCHPT